MCGEAQWTAALCEMAVQCECWALAYVPWELRTGALCRAAVQQNSKILQFVPDNLRNMEICEAAVKQNIEAMRYVPDELVTELKQRLKAQRMSSIYEGERAKVNKMRACYAGNSV
jgi:hypothetical protein